MHRRWLTQRRGIAVYVGQTNYNKTSTTMIPRIKNIKPLSGHRLYAEFDDGRKVNYDLAEDIATLPNYSMLTEIVGLFEQARLDTSRTIVYWNDLVDLPSDTIYEYGVAV